MLPEITLPVRDPLAVPMLTAPSEKIAPPAAPASPRAAEFWIVVLSMVIVVPEAPRMAPPEAVRAPAATRPRVSVMNRRVKGPPVTLNSRDASVPSIVAAPAPTLETVRSWVTVSSPLTSG